MPTTCKLIAKTTLSSNTNAVTFSSIPQTYTDLLLVCSARTSRNATDDQIRLEFNGSSSNLSVRYFGSSGTSRYTTSFTDGYVGSICGANATSNTFGSTEVYISNYAGSTTKSFYSTSTMENNAETSYMDAVAGLWSSTAAITQLTIISRNATNLVSGSSFYLYGITKA